MGLSAWVRACNPCFSEQKAGFPNRPTLEFQCLKIVLSFLYIHESRMGIWLTHLPSYMIKRPGIFHFLGQQLVEPKAVCWVLCIKRLVVCERGGRCGGSWGPRPTGGGYHFCSVYWLAIHCMNPSQCGYTWGSCLHYGQGTWFLGDSWSFMLYSSPPGDSYCFPLF